MRSRHARALPIYINEYTCYFVFSKELKRAEVIRGQKISYYLLYSSQFRTDAQATDDIYVVFVTQASGDEQRFSRIDVYQ